MNIRQVIDLGKSLTLSWADESSTWWVSALARHSSKGSNKHTNWIIYVEGEDMQVGNKKKCFPTQDEQCFGTEW